MKPLAHLKHLKLTQLKQDYPNVPEYAIPVPKYSDSSTNGLTRCVTDWLLLNGHMCERTGTEGRVIDNRKTYIDTIGQRKTIGTVKRIPSSGTKGSSDLKAIINGKFVAIEIKFGNDKQSEAQKMYQKQVENAGGIYIIVKTFDQFYEWLYSYTNGKK